jgi:hypothetical protein
VLSKKRIHATLGSPASSSWSFVAPAQVSHPFLTDSAEHGGRHDFAYHPKNQSIAGEHVEVVSVDRLSSSLAHLSIRYKRLGNVIFCPVLLLGGPP